MSISQVRTRKRHAPGTSPTDSPLSQPPTKHNTASLTHKSRPSTMPTNQYLQWPQENQNPYPDPSNSYGSSPFNDTSQSHGLSMAPSDQLARGSFGQQLVQKTDFDSSNNHTWPILTDSIGQAASGALLNQEDDLDRRAEIAKRETQAKRKQIPPFVQKLSR